MDWIWQNRAWLFDGIGATIVGGLIVWAIIRFLSASREQPRGSAVEVRADHGASLTGSPIANGSNITQTINIGAVSVPTTSPALDYRSDPTPQDILRQIRSAPPFDQARITKNY
jgi:hypothetical protein